MNNGRNPVLPPEVYIPDGEAHVYGNRLYVYGSQDSAENTYCSEQYQVVSTENMRDWTVHDVALNGNDVPWIKEKNAKEYPVVDMDLKNPAPAFQNLVNRIPKAVRLGMKLAKKDNMNLGKWMPNGQYLYAPDCVERDEKYYLYFCMANNTEGVAVSDRPEGPYNNPVQMPCAGIDPAVFQDDDGAVYYYWGQFRAAGVKLNEDMMSFDEAAVVHHIVTEEEHGFHEGSSMRKRNGIYYYVYPCVYREGKPTCLAYATGDNPLGPFKYQGIIIDNSKCDPSSWNIHGSIQEYQGQWYVFYHRSSENAQYHRRLCVEKIYFNEDGTIDEVKMTSIGAGEPFCQGEIIEGWRACEVSGGAYIKGTDLIMCEGSSAIIRYVRLDTTPSKVVVDCTGEGDISVLVDGQDIRSAQPGIHEVTIVCEGNVEVHSIIIH